VCPTLLLLLSLDMRALFLPGRFFYPATAMDARFPPCGCGWLVRLQICAVAEARPWCGDR
jgi:hypothetical protein